MYGSKKSDPHTEILIPENGVLWGTTINGPLPELITERPSENRHNGVWFSRSTDSVYYAIHEHQFCLIWSQQTPENAQKQAEHYFKKDFAAAVDEEKKKRDNAQRLFPPSELHANLIALYVENLFRALRPSGNGIAEYWSQTPQSSEPGFSINELLPLVSAWSAVDANVAQNLIRSTLSLQLPSGALPTHFRPNEPPKHLAAPLPLIAQATEIAWQAEHDPNFLHHAIPKLRRYMQWTLQHFDPQRKHLYYWQNNKEPLIENTFDTEISTADLYAMLIAEIDAINRLRNEASEDYDEIECFVEERTALERTLIEDFWNEEESSFANAIVRGEKTILTGFSAFMPAIWHDLPEEMAEKMLLNISETGRLPGGKSERIWEMPAAQTHNHPLLQHVLTLYGLKICNGNGSVLRAFSRIAIAGLTDWHTAELEEKKISIDPICASYAVALQHTRNNLRELGAISRLLDWIQRKTKIDRFEINIALVTLLAVIAIGTVYDQLRSPPDFHVLRDQAKNAYTRGDGVQALHYLLQTIEYYPEKADLARLMAANIYLLQEKYEKAAKLLELVRQKHPDSPGPMISLGLAYHLQGNFEKADQQYEEFTLLFDIIFPELTAEIQNYRYLISEGFEVPTEWKQLFQLPIMKEL